MTEYLAKILSMILGYEVGELSILSDNTIRYTKLSSQTIHTISLEDIEYKLKGLDYFNKLKMEARTRTPKYLVTADIEVDFSGGEYATEWIYDVFIGIFDTYEEADEARFSLDNYGLYVIKSVDYDIQAINC